MGRVRASSKPDPARRPAPRDAASDAPARIPPPPHALRDPWAWCAALAVVPVVLHSLGASLGEPFADDFLFLHRALLSGRFSWLDGGGAAVYWRPLARQGYVLALGRLALAHPAAVATIHAVLLALTAWLFYRALRPRLPGPLAAAIATFPLLAESSRMLIAWPSHIQDLGALLFLALALHETTRRRLPSALAALLAALLCKEVAAAAGLLLPWIPDAPASRERTPARQRWIWTAAFSAVIAAWAAVYAILHLQGGVAFPRDAQAATSRASLAVRAAWAVVQSLRATFSLAARPGTYDAAVMLAAAGIVAASIATVALRGGRGRWVVPWVLWGLGWFAAAAATLTEVHPDWWPNRALPAMPGAGAALCVLADAAHPAALAALVALRLAAFAASPGPPSRVEVAPPAGQAFDFAHLARLQRLVAATRRALQEGYPRLPRGARVAWSNLPAISEYAFAGSRALQLWYGDTSLVWVPASDFQAHRDRPPMALAVFQFHREPEVVLVSRAAASAYYDALDAIGGDRNDEALTFLRRADSLQADRRAESFLGGLVGVRAFVDLRADRLAAAAFEARRSLVLWPDNVGAHVVLGFVELRSGQFAAARAQAESALAIRPSSRDARAILESARQAEARGP